MGGVAAALAKAGYVVQGSETDLYEPMKSYLADSGVQVFPEFSGKHLDQFAPDLVVVGNAVSRGVNPELEHALNLRLPIKSLPEIISEGLIARNQSVVIAGTHGKTTTTSMTAHLLHEGGWNPGFMIGGVPGNFDVSCRPVPAERHNTDQGLFVIEGDEYDSAYFDKRSKFLHYRPTVGVVNNIEFDHADIFSNLDDVLKSFRLFIRTVSENGLLLVNGDDPNIARLLGDKVSPIATFGLGEHNDWRATRIESGEFGVRFHVQKEGRAFGTFSCALPGEHNARNLLAAIAVADFYGVPVHTLQAATESYVPPKRRMQELATWQGRTVIDDFAHHPTAIRETLRAVAARYPGRRIFVSFEPRSNTTTRNLFQRELEECFEGASGVLLGALDRPWRYSDEERLDTVALQAALQRQGMFTFAIENDLAGTADWGKYHLEKLSEWTTEGDVIVLLSNGNLGGLRAMLSSG